MVIPVFPMFPIVQVVAMGVRLALYHPRGGTGQMVHLLYLTGYKYYIPYNP